MSIFTDGKFKYSDNRMEMGAALQIDLSFEQVLSLVKQLPAPQKMEILRELGQEAVDFKISRFLEAFKTNDLSLELIEREVESVRQELYDKDKH